VLTAGAAPQPAIPAGTTVTAVNAAANPPTVTLSNNVIANIPALTNIHFTPNVTAAAGGGLPQLQMPSTDWLAGQVHHCL
jgi:hypothetical protein